MPANESYGEIFADMIDKQAKFIDRGDIFRRLDISRNQFYNVTNPNRTTSGGNPYPFPTEWIVRATREFSDFSLIKFVATDCGGLFISPEDIEELETANAERVLEIFSKVIGKVRKK